jgi:hypothetical protein
MGALTLPKMDVPVGVVQWEVFLPKQYAVAAFGGDAIPANLMPAAADLEEFAELRPGNRRSFAPPTMAMDTVDDSSADTGAAFVANQLEGRALDPAGAALRGATVVATNLATGATRTVTADNSGTWMLSGMPAGRTRVTVSAPGFRTQTQAVDLTASGGAQMETLLQVGSSSQTVEVSAASEALVMGSSVSGGLGGRGGGGPGGGKANLDQNIARQQAATKDAQTSQNVLDLQKRVAGVLPIAVNVPHAGNSYRFVRPLVVDEETRVTFNYRIGK